MDAIQLLKKQHDEVEDLFAEFEDTEDKEEKREIFTKIADALAAHGTIEEKVFYPAAYKRGEEELTDMLKEAVEEHLSLKRIIADLLAMTPDDENFEAKVKVLKEQVEHHVEEEEKDLFPTAKQELSTESLETMGADMEAMFEALIPTQPRFEIPSETEEAAPLA